MNERDAFLAALDENEDELIDRQELQPNKVNNPYYGDFEPPQRMRPGQREGPSFVQIMPGQPVEGYVKQLIAHYDKDKNGKLSREEIALPKAEFDALDTNKDGQLDATELAAFFKRAPDLEMMTRPGPMTKGNKGWIDQAVRTIGTEMGYKMSSSNKRVELFNPRKEPLTLASAFKPVNNVAKPDAASR